MPEYSYTKVPGKLKDFLGKIRSLGVPSSLTTRWLESIGYKSTNDRSILPVIRQIKFIDDKNTPTDKWVSYRGGNYKQILASGIQEGYPDLFAIYPDAYSRSTEELENFFSTKSTAGKQVISTIVATFKALCELADFPSNSVEQVEESKTSTEAGVVEKSSTLKPMVKENINQGKSDFVPKLHIDIQIHISPDATPQQIEQIFESMAKHLYKIKD